MINLTECIAVQMLGQMSCAMNARFLVVRRILLSLMCVDRTASGSWQLMELKARASKVAQAQHKRTAHPCQAGSVPVGRSGRVSESLADGQAATGRPTATDNQAQCQWAAGAGLARAAARGGLGVSVPLRVGVAAATE